MFKLTRTIYPSPTLQDRVRDTMPLNIDPKKVFISDWRIEYYNSFTKKCKIKCDQKSITYKSTVKLLNQFQRGHQHKLLFDKKWRDMYNIDEDILHHKFTDRELKVVIRSMGKLREPGFEPINKISVEKANLLSLLYYNGFYGGPQSSWFLRVFVNGVKQTYQSQVQKEWGVSRYKRVMEEICEMFGVNEQEWTKKGELLGYMNKIDKWVRTLPEDCGGFNYELGPSKEAGPRFVDHYVERYLSEEHNNGGDWYRRGHNLSCFNIKSKMFRQYLDYHWNRDQLGNTMGKNYPAYDLSFFLNDYFWGPEVAVKRNDDNDPSKEDDRLCAAMREDFNNTTDEEWERIRTMSDEEWEKEHPLDIGGNPIPGGTRKQETTKRPDRPTHGIDPFSPEAVAMAWEQVDEPDPDQL